MTMNVTGAGPAIPLARTAVSNATQAALEALAAAATPSKPAAQAEGGPRAADPLGGAAQAVPDLDAITVPVEEDRREANAGTQSTGGGGTGTRGGPRRSA